MRLTNSMIDKEILQGEKYLLSDDFYYKRECSVLGILDKLVVIDFIECESYEECEYYNDGLKPVLDVTEDTPTLYVMIGDTEIPILVEEIVDIEMIDYNII